MLGRAGRDRLEVWPVHRFGNGPVAAGGHLYTDILRLYAEVLTGLRAAAAVAELASAGIDSWGVDYGLLDAAGTLVGNPVHYRDTRTQGVLPRLLARIPAGELYATTGIQQLPINTLCQLLAEEGSPALERARTLLLLPDLLGYWLTGSAGAELTNASTTQLLDVRTRTWATVLMERAGIPAGLFPPLRQPGEQVGGLLPGPAAQAGLAAGLPVLAVASHDTASAVAAIPATSGNFAFIAAGTWSLAGLELAAPVLSGASQAANFTNEAGLDGTVRYLRNAGGLWLLQESMRTWQQAGQRITLRALLAGAARAQPLRSVIDVDDPAFLPPGDMPARIRAACEGSDQPVPATAEEVARCILDSLALAHRRAVTDARRLSGKPVEVVHVVGGGARNALLCQLTADACDLPVLAGPVEATAIGNVLVQARSLGAVPAELAGMRSLVAATQPLRSYRPRQHAASWESAARRLGSTGVDTLQPGR